MCPLMPVLNDDIEAIEARTMRRNLPTSCFCVVRAVHRRRPCGAGGCLVAWGDSRFAGAACGQRSSADSVFIRCLPIEPPAEPACLAMAAARPTSGTARISNRSALDALFNSYRGTHRIAPPDAASGIIRAIRQTETFAGVVDSDHHAIADGLDERDIIAGGFESGR